MDQEQRVLRSGDKVDVIDGGRRRPAVIKHFWNTTGELVAVLSTEPPPDVLCANDDGAGHCGHPEHVHGALGCMSEDPCWCDEYVSPKSALRERGYLVDDPAEVAALRAVAPAQGEDVERAVREVLREQGVGMPYMARTDNFTDDAGNVDLAALRAADEDADRRNAEFVRCLILAATGRRPR